jgi:hypothetical protein
VLRLSSHFGDFTIYVECRQCRHEGKLLPRDLTKRYGYDALVAPLLKQLRCSKCNSRQVHSRVRMKANLR